MEQHGTAWNACEFEGLRDIGLGTTVKLRATILFGTALASLAALTVAGGGVASAADGVQIDNLGNARAGRPACLTAQAAPGTAITQEQCTGADNQHWVYIGTPANGNPIQIKNFGTGLCMDISAFSNAAPVVQADCGPQPIGSYWNRNLGGTFGGSTPGYRLKANAANYCLDLENGWTTFGLSMQVWQCNSNTLNQVWNIFG
jgi:hypothetical protein